MLMQKHRIQTVVFLAAAFLSLCCAQQALAGWSFMDGGRPQDELRGLWGSSENDIFAVGANGRVVHYDGASWSVMPSAASGDLLTVWGASPADVFAGGSSGIYHFDGASWQQMDNASATRCIWGSSGADVFGAARAGDYRPQHYDGVAWSYMSALMFETNSLWGTSGTDVFAVGSGLLRYNGVAWNQIDDANVSERPLMNAVWGSSSEDVYAVGLSGYILHYNGTSWNMVYSEGPELKSIWGSSADDVFAVGLNGTILHYDGTSWQTMASGTETVLNAVWGTSGSNVYAAGGGSIFRYDGTSWSCVYTLSEGAYGLARHALRGVWAGPDGTSVAVGAGNFSMHLTGDTWSARPRFRLVQSWFNAVWGVSPDTVFAVGGTTFPIDRDFPIPKARGIIERYDGRYWKRMYVGYDSILTGIWGSSATDVFAVGSDGLILHYNGRIWLPMSSGTDQMLGGVWGSSANDVFAVGKEGTVVHYNGSGWSIMGNFTRGWLNGVWGSSGTDVYAVGAIYDAKTVYDGAPADTGVILHYNGTAWSVVMETERGLNGVWGRSADDVFAVGYGGLILHYDGSAWSTMNSSTACALTGISGTQEHIYAVGTAGGEGIIMSYQP